MTAQQPTHATISLNFPETLPFDFRVGILRPQCPALAKFGHLTNAKAVGRSTTIAVNQLAATAALRHFGCKISTELAIAKEKMTWMGWMQRRPDGYLTLATHTTGHAARLAECSASLAEALALQLTELIFQYPVQNFSRVKEKAVLGMDFAAMGNSGEVAIEAKARGGWRSGTASSDIHKGFAKRKTATEKYGFLLLYQQGAGKKRRKSHVIILDPPGSPRTVGEPERSKAVLEHYYQVTMSMGLWYPTAVLAQELGMPEPPSINRGVLDRAVANPSSFPWPIRIKIRSRTYVGRFFDTPPEPAPAHSAWPTIFYGLDLEVARMLLASPPGLGGWLMRYGQENIGGFAFRTLTPHGRADYAGLSDGILRIDLSTREQLKHDDLDVPPNLPLSVMGRLPKGT